MDTNKLKNHMALFESEVGGAELRDKGRSKALIARLAKIIATPIYGNHASDHEIFDVIHNFLMDETIPMDMRISAMKKLDQVTGETSEEVTAQSVNDYVAYETQEFESQEQEDETLAEVDAMFEDPKEFHVYEFDDRGSQLNLINHSYELSTNYDSFADFADEIKEQFSIVAKPTESRDVSAFITGAGAVIVADHELDKALIKQLHKRLQAEYTNYLAAEEEAQADSDAQQRDPHGYRGVSPTDFN